MEKLFDCVMVYVVVPLALVLTIGLGVSLVVGVPYAAWVVAHRPYAQGDTVIIKAIGLPAVVQAKSPSTVQVSYVDDFGRMSQATLLYSEVRSVK
jgi:hypothetical protein